MVVFKMILVLAELGDDDDHLKCWRQLSLLHRLPNLENTFFGLCNNTILQDEETKTIVISIETIDSDKLSLSIFVYLSFTFEFLSFIFLYLPFTFVYLSVTFVYLYFTFVYLSFTFVHLSVTFVHLPFTFVHLSFTLFSFVCYLCVLVFYLCIFVRYRIVPHSQLTSLHLKTFEFSSLPFLSSWSSSEKLPRVTLK